MDTAPQRQPEAPRARGSELAPDTLVLASIGSAAGTVVIGRFGLAGTLLGAALFPVVVALAKELARRPARRLPTQVRRRGGGTAPVETRAGRSRVADVPWPRVVATAAVAFALVVAAFTLTELALGRSLVSERPTTFFSPGEQQPAPPADEPGAPPPDEPPVEEPPVEDPVEPPAEEPPPVEPPPEEPPAEEAP